MMMLKMINPMSSMPVSFNNCTLLNILILIKLQTVPGAGESKEEPSMTREEQQVGRWSEEI